MTKLNRRIARKRQPGLQRRNRVAKELTLRGSRPINLSKIQKI